PRRDYLGAARAHAASPARPGRTEDPDPLTQPIFDTHLHIIDPAHPLGENNGFMPDPFTVADDQGRVAGPGVAGGVGRPATTTSSAWRGGWMTWPAGTPSVTRRRSFRRSWLWIRQPSESAPVRPPRGRAARSTTTILPSSERRS